MVLKALEIQGFKSFPDKTRITFEQGITGVVGPNGSGKSNISDAIRWVLGETSIKELRGGGHMENVIFGGTSARKQMGYAAVSLILDNRDKALSIDKDEAIITRRYYRSGESEYAVNGQPVRLKDIYELFLDTGLGRDGFSMIGQGKIAAIIGAKGQERREIFEEASGIAKYRYRKNEAERKLTAAEENLVRLRDILTELESRVGPLEQEAEKAKAYLALSEEKKNLEITYWVDSIRRAKQALQEHRYKEESAQADYQKAQNALLSAEQKEENLFEANRALETENESIAAKEKELLAEEGRLDAEKAALQSDLRHAEEGAKLAQQRLAASQADAEARSGQHQQLQNRLADSKAKEQALEQALEQAEALLAKAAAEGEGAKGERAQLEEALLALASQDTDHKIEEASLKAFLEGSGTRESGLAQELSALRLEQQNLHTAKEAGDAALRGVRQQLSQLHNITDGLREKLSRRQKSAEEAAAAAQKAENSLLLAKERLATLTELEQSHEGYGGSVRAVLKAADDRRLRGIIGPVSSVLRVKKGYETAVETSLGYAAQNLVVEDEKAAQAAIAYLKEYNAGRATFLPLDTLQARPLSEKELAGATLASAAVEFEERYRKVAENLLGGVLIVDEIRAASRTAKDTGYRLRVVTLDGQVINTGGSYTGGSVAKSAGFFTRRREMEDVSARLSSLQKELQNLRGDWDVKKEEAAAVAAQLLAAEGQWQEAREQEIRLAAEEERLNGALTENAGRAAALQAASQELAAAVENARQKIGVIVEKTAQNAAESQRLTALLTEKSTAGDSFLEASRQAAQQRGELSMALYGAKRDSEALQKELETLVQLAEDRDRAEQSALREDAARVAEMERLSALVTEAETKKEALRQQGAQLAEQARQITQKRFALEEETVALRAETRRLSEEKENLSRETARLEEKKASLENEHETLIGKLFEEYELTLPEASAFTVAFENVTSLRRRVEEVRRKLRALGDVHVGAIEEYKEVSSRYTFLKEQTDDVEKSRRELFNMIASLEKEMRELFSQRFAEISRQFSRIFTELFGGGSARLYLEDQEDLLGSGIELEVAPPGKIIKNLAALSGGEQALVAICIYFAILAVNPAPFCVLDEIEAALDDANVVRFAEYLRRICDRSQFIVITHRRGTMEEADTLYGVTMQEEGVSKVLRLAKDGRDVNLVS